MVDVYPRPDRGLHLSTAAGLLVTHAAVHDPVVDAIGGVGAAATVALGYDAWVGREWSLGVAARGLLGGTAGEHEGAASTGSERTLVTSVGLTVSVLHH